MSTEANILTPVGRLVRGSLYKGNDKDAEGRPLLVKSGPQQGQPRVDYFFAIAIPKGAERHWAETAWGRLIWSVGHAAFPAAAQAPTFAWKVTDGDSTIPNKRGVKPVDREGFPGHWVLGFSSGFPPKVFADGGRTLLDTPDAVKLGYYVEVAGTIAGNGSPQQPGVFLNHRMVCLAGYGPEIIVGPDPTSVGFGQALPAGASSTPVGGFAPPAAAPAAPGLPLPPPMTGGHGPAAQGMPPLPGYVPPALPAAAAPAAPPPPIAVAPNPALLAAPLPPAAPIAPPLPVAPLRQMTAKAGGWAYNDLIKNGWTDASLIAAGMMLP